MTNSRLYQTKLYRFFVLPLLSFTWFALLAGAMIAYMYKENINLWAFFIFIPGLILFLIAKVQVIKSGRLLSFGATAAELMTKQNRFFYYGGYILMIIGFLLLFSNQTQIM